MKVSDDSWGKIMSFFFVVSALPAFVLPGQITQFTQSKSKMLKQCRGCAETVFDTPVLLQRALCCSLCTQNCCGDFPAVARNYFSTVSMKCKDPNNTYSWMTFRGFFLFVFLHHVEFVWERLNSVWLKIEGKIFCFVFVFSSQNPCKSKIKWNNYHGPYADVMLDI